MENNTISNVTTTASNEEVEKLHKSFYPATLIYGSLPYRPIESNLWVRENGRNRTAITAGAITNPDGTVESFIPSGKLARAALLYLTTEAKKTGSPRIDLSKSYRGFLKDLGLKWDSKTAKNAEKQLRAVLSMTINVSITEHRENGDTKITEYDLMVGRGREIVFDANALVFNLGCQALHRVSSALREQLSAQQFSQQAAAPCKHQHLLYEHASGYPPYGQESALHE